MEGDVEVVADVWGEDVVCLEGHGRGWVVGDDLAGVLDVDGLEGGCDGNGVTRLEGRGGALDGAGHEVCGEEGAGEGTHGQGAASRDGGFWGKGEEVVGDVWGGEAWGGWEEGKGELEGDKERLVGQNLVEFGKDGLEGDGHRGWAGGEEEVGSVRVSKGGVKGCVEPWGVWAGDVGCRGFVKHGEHALCAWGECHGGQETVGGGRAENEGDLGSGQRVEAAEEKDGEVHVDVRGVKGDVVKESGERALCGENGVVEVDGWGLFQAWGEEVGKGVGGRVVVVRVYHLGAGECGEVLGRGGHVFLATAGADLVPGIFGGDGRGRALEGVEGDDVVVGETDVGCVPKSELDADAVFWVCRRLCQASDLRGAVESAQEGGTDGLGADEGDHEGHGVGDGRAGCCIAGEREGDVPWVAVDKVTAVDVGGDDARERRVVCVEHVSLPQGSRVWDGGERPDVGLVGRQGLPQRRGRGEEGVGADVWDGGCGKGLKDDGAGGRRGGDDLDLGSGSL